MSATPQQVTPEQIAARLAVLRAHLDTFKQADRRAELRQADERHDDPRIELHAGEYRADLHFSFHSYGNKDRVLVSLYPDAYDLKRDRITMSTAANYNEREQLPTTEITIAADRFFESDGAKIAADIERRLITPLWPWVLRVHDYAERQSARLAEQLAVMAKVRKMIGAREPNTERGEQWSETLYGGEPFSEVQINVYDARLNDARRVSVTLRRFSVDLATFEAICKLVAARKADRHE